LSRVTHNFFEHRQIDGAEAGELFAEALEEGVLHGHPKLGDLRHQAQDRAGRFLRGGCEFRNGLVELGRIANRLDRVAKPPCRDLQRADGQRGRTSTGGQQAQHTGELAGDGDNVADGRDDVGCDDHGRRDTGERGGDALKVAGNLAQRGLVNLGLNGRGALLTRQPV